MMGRISRSVMFSMMARAAAMRSTCHRLNVGAIVTHENSPVSVGWNGAAAGAPHCAGNACPGIVPGNCGTLHAEANALKKAHVLLGEGQRVEVDLYATHSPCPECATMILQHGLYIKRIFFEFPYRSTQHLSMFSVPYRDPDGWTPDTPTMRKTEVYEVTPAGYIVDYSTRKVIEFP